MVSCTLHEDADLRFAICLEADCELKRSTRAAWASSVSRWRVEWIVTRISFRSFNSPGDLSLAASRAATISLLSSCEIAIELPAICKRLKKSSEVASYSRVVTTMLTGC